MAKRKIVFIIVEGPSDDEALGVILTRLFASQKVHVEITHGDITSDIKNNPSRIISKTAEIVKDYAADNHFTKKNFQEIIHLMDTDGTYIPDHAVREDSDATVKPVYSLTGICSAYPADIRARNHRKQANMDRLVSCGTIWGIPYHAYYMSSNLDHVLYNKQNSTDSEKENDAFQFAMKYKDHLDEFMIFISDSDFSVNADYIASWRYIRENLHSLERHTNLCICLKGIDQKGTICDEPN